MGLIRAAMNAAGSVLGDQWKEYFYCDAIDESILVVKGKKRTSNKRQTSNTKGEDNIITNGSVIAINEGQCMLIVDQGKVAEVCAEPGEFVYDSSTEPSVFSGSLGDSIAQSFKNVGRRFTFGGDAPKDQRVYFVNTKEIIGNKYGTANPVPFRVIDQNIGLDMDIAIKCFGEYSYKIVDPVLFYTNVCGNVVDEYERSEIDSQLKTELLTALQPAFGKLSAQGIRYSALPGSTQEIADALNEVLTAKWRNQRGLAVASFGVSSVKASEEDEKMIKTAQMNAINRNPGMAAATLVSAQADAMKAAASNEHAGAMFGFAGMNMAQQAGGMNAGNLFAMDQQNGGQTQPINNGGFGNMQPQQAAPNGAGFGNMQPQQAPAQQAAPSAGTAGGWICPTCGQENTTNFCSGCGTKKPEQPVKSDWFCPDCGTKNEGKFCTNCGHPKP